jgi:hypothetical protein
METSRMLLEFNYSRCCIWIMLLDWLFNTDTTFGFCFRVNIYSTLHYFYFLSVKSILVNFVENRNIGFFHCILYLQVKKIMATNFIILLYWHAKHLILCMNYIIRSSYFFFLLCLCWMWPDILSLLDRSHSLLLFAAVLLSVLQMVSVEN